MPKPPNPIESVPLQVTTTPHVREYLERLVLTGLHGKNAAEAAERLLARSLEALIDAGKLAPIPPDTNSKGGPRS